MLVKDFFMALGFIADSDYTDIGRKMLSNISLENYQAGKVLIPSFVLDGSTDDLTNEQWYHIGRTIDETNDQIFKDKISLIELAKKTANGI
jgi:hypothetical protein